MTQQNDVMRPALTYLRHQGSKDFPELDALMRSAAGDWQRCLEGMSEEQAGFQPSPNAGAAATPISGEGPKWSAKEVIGHFLMSERSLNQQVAARAGVPAPGASVPSVDRMGMQSADDERQPVEELRRRLNAFFDETRAFLTSLQAGDPDASFPHPVFGPLKAKEWIAFHRLHSMDHIRQIENIKSDPGYPRG